MKLTHKAHSLLAAALLGGVLLAGTASAQEPMHASFSALQGIDAEALTVEQMQAISGELNAYDIAAYLFAQADRYAVRFPQLSASLTKLANETLANAVQINAAFARLHILTPCTSSLCP